MTNELAMTRFKALLEQEYSPRPRRTRANEPVSR